MLVSFSCLVSIDGNDTFHSMPSGLYVQSLSHANESGNEMKIIRLEVCSLPMTGATSALISCLQNEIPKITHGTYMSWTCLDHGICIFNAYLKTYCCICNWEPFVYWRSNKVFSFGQNIIVKHLYTVVSYTPAVVDIKPSGVATVYTTVN